MDILSIVILLFIVLETSNVVILYFKPDSRMGNGVAVFDEWEESKKDPDLHRFIEYLVYWVAGSKLIFIMLLIVILLTGTTLTKVLSAFVMILSIATFYWKLYPIIRQLDKRGYITPKNYSKTLGWMIGGFIGVFLLALIIFILANR